MNESVWTNLAMLFVSFLCRCTYSVTALLQFRVLSFGFFSYGDISVGVLPLREEFHVPSFRFCAVTR